MKGRWFSRLLGWYPPYWGTGITIEMSDDYSTAEARMPLRFYNRNYFGSHFGGSLYSMVDPIFALMLANRLGAGYTVWDQAASIEFVKAGRGTVTASFDLGDERLADVLRATAEGGKYTPVWQVDVLDEAGDLVARITKTLYVRRRPS